MEFHFYPRYLGKMRNNKFIHSSYMLLDWDLLLVTKDNWKLRYINSEDSFQLYDLNQDYREENDVSTSYPEIVDRLKTWMLNACDGDYTNGTPGAHLAAYPK